MRSDWEMLVALCHNPDVIDRECDEEHQNYQRPDGNVLRPDAHPAGEISIVRSVPIAVGCKVRLCLSDGTGKGGSEDDDCDDDQKPNETTDDGVHGSGTHAALSACHV